MKRKYTLPLLIATLLNFFLFVTKLFIGLRTNSLCIYTDGINNLLDALAVLIACIGTLFLQKPATKAHPFGFGRAEYILEFVMSLFITLTGLKFAYDSLVRLMMPTPVWFYPRYAYLLALSCIVKLLLGFYFWRLQKKYASDILRTVMLDSFLDTGVTAVALLSFTLSNRMGIVLDGFVGLFISLFISVSGIRLICLAVSKLLGKAPTNATQQIELLLQTDFPTLQVKEIQLHDYGTACLLAQIRLQGTKPQDRPSLQAQIKSEIQKKISIQTSIEWEDN